MKSTQLLRFVLGSNLEYHWHDNDGSNDVIMFVPLYYIEEFNKMLGAGIMDEEGIKCTMKDGYFCFWMNDICEYFGIEIENIFEEGK